MNDNTEKATPPPIHHVHAERSYDQRFKAIAAFNTCTGGLDDKLDAAWLASLNAAKVTRLVATPAPAGYGPLWPNGDGGRGDLPADGDYTSLAPAAPQGADAYEAWLRENRLPGNIRARQLFDSARATTVLK